MRFQPINNAAWRVLVRTATGVVIGLMIAATAAAESNSEGVDWIVDGQAESTGKLSVSIDTEPAAFVYGEVVNATIEVANGTNEDRQVDIKVLLGEVALFVRGDHGVKFVLPDLVEHERRLAWPALSLPAGAKGRVSFQFLVNWNSVSNNVYILVEALDPRKDDTVAVAQIQEPPQYPEGTGSFLERYGYFLVTVILGGALFYGVYRARRRMEAGDSIPQCLSGISMGVGAVFIILFTSGVSSEFVPWFGWEETTGKILDVRYTLSTSQMSSSQGPSQTVYHYSGCLVLSYEGPEGPVIASGFRQQSSISDPDFMNKYRTGSETVCYYDPSYPADFVVDRDLFGSNMLTALAFAIVGLLLFSFGYRSRRSKSNSESA